MRPWFVLFAVWGCTKAEIDTDPDTDADTDAGADTDVDPASVLWEGYYFAETVGLDDGCANFGVSFFAEDAELTWTDADTFGLVYAGSRVETSCEYPADGAVTCDGYVQTFPVPDDVTLDATSVTEGFTVLGPGRFEQIEFVTLDCSNPACDAFAAEKNQTMPCSFRLTGRYSQ